MYKINYFIVHNEIPSKITILDFVNLLEKEEDLEIILYIIYDFYYHIFNNLNKDKIKIYFKKSVLKIKKVL